MLVDIVPPPTLKSHPPFARQGVQSQRRGLFNLQLCPAKHCPSSKKPHSGTSERKPPIPDHRGAVSDEPEPSEESSQAFPDLHPFD